jgi:DHA1 family multidrug resistance protein-like MFS transporter
MTTTAREEAVAADPVAWYGIVGRSYDVRLTLLPIRRTGSWSTGVWALLIDSFASNLGFFLLVPVLAVHLTRDMGWPAWEAGLVLAIRQLSQQGLAPWGGAAADRIGYRSAVVLGMEVRALGFILFAFAHSAWLVFVAAILSGLGGALFGPADAAALAVVVEGEERARVFARRVVFGNAGMILGPVIGAYLVTADFALVAWLAGLLFLSAGIFTAVFYPAAASRPRPNAAEGVNAWRLVLANRPFVQLTLIVSGYYLLNSQINILIPLVVVFDHQSPAIVGWMLALYSGVTLLLQTRVTERVKSLPVERQLVWGLLAATVGMAISSLSTWVVWALVPGVLALSAAAMLINPALFTATARLAEESAFGLFYGFSRLSLGVGGSLGNAVGGLLFSWGTAVGLPGLPWMVMGVMGLISAQAMRRWSLHPSVQATGRASL